MNLNLYNIFNYILVELIALNILPYSAIKYIKVYFIALLQRQKFNFNVLYCTAFPNIVKNLIKLYYVIDLVILHAIKFSRNFYFIYFVLNMIILIPHLVQDVNNNI